MSPTVDSLVILPGIRLEAQLNKALAVRSPDSYVIGRSRPPRGNSCINARHDRTSPSRTISRAYLNCRKSLNALTSRIIINKCGKVRWMGVPGPHTNVCSRRYHSQLHTRGLVGVAPWQPCYTPVPSVDSADTISKYVTRL